MSAASSPLCRPRRRCSIRAAHTFSEGATSIHSMANFIILHEAEAEPLTSGTWRKLAPHVWGYSLSFVACQPTPARARSYKVVAEKDLGGQTKEASPLDAGRPPGLEARIVLSTAGCRVLQEETCGFPCWPHRSIFCKARCRSWGEEVIPYLRRSSWLLHFCLRHFASSPSSAHSVRLQAHVERGAIPS